MRSTIRQQRWGLTEAILGLISSFQTWWYKDKGRLSSWCFTSNWSYLRYPKATKSSKSQGNIASPTIKNLAFCQTVWHFKLFHHDKNQYGTHLNSKMSVVYILQKPLTFTPMHTNTEQCVSLDTYNSNPHYLRAPTLIPANAGMAQHFIYKGLSSCRKKTGRHCPKLLFRLNWPRPPQSLNVITDELEKLAPIPGYLRERPIGTHRKPIIK